MVASHRRRKRAAPTLIDSTGRLERAGIYTSIEIGYIRWVMSGVHKRQWWLLSRLCTYHDEVEERDGWGWPVWLWRPASKRRTAHRRSGWVVRRSFDTTSARRHLPDHFTMEPPHYLMKLLRAMELIVRAAHCTFARIRETDRKGLQQRRENSKNNGDI